MGPAMGGSCCVVIHAACQTLEEAFRFITGIVSTTCASVHALCDACTVLSIRRGSAAVVLHPFGLSSTYRVPLAKYETLRP